MPRTPRIRPEPKPKAKGEPNRGGRPTKYDETMGDRLVAHMRRGHTFKSFGDAVGVCEDTLWNWSHRYEAFEAAHRRGEMAAEGFYTNLLQSIAGGQLKRVASETPVMGPDGQPAIGPDGKVVMRREYAAVRGNAACAIFLTKNICKWRDVQDQRHSGDPKNPIHTVQTDAERDAQAEADAAELQAYRTRWQECGDD